MNYGYIRVSTDKQTVENQRFEIMGFCERENIVIDRWIEETISGTMEPERRKLGRVLGRPKGRKNKRLKLTGREGEILRLLNSGYSQARIARRMKVHRITLSRFLRNQMGMSSGKPEDAEEGMRVRRLNVEREAHAETPRAQRCCGSACAGFRGFLQVGDKVIGVKEKNLLACNGQGGTIEGL